MATHYSSFNDYVADQLPIAQERLRAIRSIIREEVPNAEETMNYNIPAFALVPGGKREEQIMIAGYAQHVGLYPHPTTMERFDSELSEYKRAKGSVQFPHSKELPTKLIRAMIRYRCGLLA